MNVQLFIPCFVDQLYPQTAFNTVKVLQKAGCTVTYNERQTCCGQPAFNAGFWNESKGVCSKFLDDFNPDDVIVAPSASCVGLCSQLYKKAVCRICRRNQCGTCQQEYLRTVGLLVNVLRQTDFGATLEGTATYHDSCAGCGNATSKMNRVNYWLKSTA
jgi:L-lactate dehydrogenase complex protein LldE